jgi:hypothetical protein
VVQAALALFPLSVWVSTRWFQGYGIQTAQVQERLLLMAEVGGEAVEQELPASEHSKLDYPLRLSRLHFE